MSWLWAMPDWLFWLLVGFGVCVAIVVICEVLPVDKWLDRWEKDPDSWP